MSNREVAATILSQLGGNRFVAMTGSSSFVYGDNMLNFRVGSNPKRVKAVRITLEPSDTYKVEFLVMRNLKMITLSEASGVYCDNLREVFENHTGLLTSL